MTFTRSIGRSAAIAFVASAAALLAVPAHGWDDNATQTTFTYQGELILGGEPLDGVVDLEFSLWNAAIGGGQIGGSVLCEDVQVMSGRFTAGVDLGAEPFNGQPRWVQISVDGAPLSPRQRITGVPHALSTRGLTVDDDDNADLVGRLFAVPDDDFVGVNRSQRVSLQEFFGVSAPVESGFGGMYIRTDGADAEPFYGYSSGGGVSAFHYYDPAADAWKLNIGSGERLTVTGDGFVGVNRDEQITGAEFFGVEAPVDSGFGGMYVSTTGAAGLPFYGYSAGGGVDAYTYYAPSGRWALALDGDRISVLQSNGYVGFSVSVPTQPLQMASGAHCTVGGTWVNASSIALKENFETVDGRGVLERLAALPIQAWNYRSEDDGVRHIGPTAEAFKQAFGLGGADDSIATVDADGIALAAIQGLHEMIEAKSDRIAELSNENDELRTLLAEVLDRVDRLERQLP